MIKAIIFDFGKVICTFDNRIFYKSVSEYSGKTKNELYVIFHKAHNIFIKYETGLITSDEFFKIIVKLADLKITKQQFIKCFADIFTPIPATFRIIKKLKKNYKLGILSNTSEWHFEYGIKKIKIFKMFNAVSLSYKVKVMKPGKKIYLDALNKLKVKPSECIFIDDIKENVTGAEKIGITGIQYTTSNNLISSLKKLNVVI
ncbi:MAG: HAD family phosphatase [Elusimicrobia bacterium]|nr:HAD family phosphatase [Elusimicrobiota bacterium]